MFVLQDDVGVTRCECGAEICCNSSDDMPERCPRCGEVLDFTFADADNKDTSALVRMVEEAAELKLVETTKDGKYRLNVREGENRVWKELSLYQAAKVILEEENGVSLLQTNIQETKALRWKAYEIYRLNWMLEQGFGIGDLFSSIAAFANCEDRKDKNAASELFDRWEQNSGFISGFNASPYSGCCLWVSYDKFIGADIINSQYQDIFTMLEMLPKKMHRAYLTDFAHLTGYKPASLFVTTKSGSQVTERCFVISGPCPKLFQYVSSGPKAPAMAQWREARVRQDNGVEYTLEKIGNEWEIEPF